MPLPMSLGQVLLCPSCKANIPPSPDNFDAYFSHQEQRCPACGNRLDWWALVTDALEHGFLGLQYAPIRSIATVGEIELKEGEITAVDFEQMGVPATARILSMHYTPIGEEGGVLIPLEVRANVAKGQEAPRPMGVYPMPIGDRPPDRVKVSVLVVWIEERTLGIAGSRLVSALGAFNEGRLEDAVVNGAVAVEVAVEPVVAAFLERYASAKPVAQTLRRSGLQGQLEVLLPVVSGTSGASPMPGHIGDALGALRQVRNRVVHDGRLPARIERAQIARAIGGAVFGVEYTRMLASRLGVSASSGDTAAKDGV